MHADAVADPLAGGCHARPAFVVERPWVPGNIIGSVYVQLPGLFAVRFPEDYAEVSVTLEDSDHEQGWGD